MRARRRGFTLVELLVVIAVIVLLIAILLPVLGRAMEGARRTKCQANLHQIAVAIQLYKNDQRMYPPDYSERPGVGILLPAGQRWFGPVDAQGKPTGRAPGYGLATLYPSYVSNTQVFNCPNNPVRQLSDPNDLATPASTPPFRCYNSYDGIDPVVLAAAGGNLATSEGMLNGSALKYRRTPWNAVIGASMSRAQYKRMLSWRNAPEDTIVTWCTQHRADPAAPTTREGDVDIVVYLNGATRRLPPNPNSGQIGHATTAAGE